MARSLSFLCVCALLLVGCGDDPDPRFRTPELTVRTLMSVYGVQELTEEEVRQRLAARARFELRDAETYRECFVDWNSAHDEGLAGYVFGRLAAAKDHLRFERVRGTDDIAVRFPDARTEGGRAAVILRETPRGYRFVLRESVPREVRAQLRQVYQRALERERG